MASPYGFSESTVEFYEKLKRLLAKAGHTVIDPWDLSKDLIERTMPRANRESSVKKTEILHEMNFQIGEANRAAIEKADLVVAALDGSDVDSGTASEVGYSFARGKKIVGYRGDFRLTGENVGALVNLQVQYWIEKSGGRIVRNVPDLLKTLEMA